ncbi:MAG: mechanosensitive ion channel family protein [Oscillospiraceae bacterium]|nr:mechanosensitive ion channel family protein [Oscillospiraceae bacterium]
MDKKEIRRRANTYFFSKVAINALLIIIGAILISFFLRELQHRSALERQKINSNLALSEAVSILESNEQDAEELRHVFHSGNQAMLDDLKDLLYTGLFSELAEASAAERAAVFTDMIARSGVDYLYVMSDDGLVLLAPDAGATGSDLVESGQLSADNRDLLLAGTRTEDGDVRPAFEENENGRYYFYSVPLSYGTSSFHLVLGAKAETLERQIAALTDVSVVLGQSNFGENGFLFAVDRSSGIFLYYRNGDEVLTGLNAAEAGLTESALRDGYTGLQTINGTRYYCVSRAFGDQTVICAVADESTIYAHDRYVLAWTIFGFVTVMLLCLLYAVIIRNDFVRKAVETEKKILFQRKGKLIFFNRSIFRKVFPLMLAGVLLIWGISFYTQTLLEISEGITRSQTALDEVTTRYRHAGENRDLAESYYENRSLAMAKLVSYLLEENPYLLNTPTERYHSVYDEDNERVFLTDDEGNRLRSISESPALQAMCDANDLNSIYVYDEDGHTIATNTSNWFFSISHNPDDQSYPFRDVLDGRADYYLQELMTNDLGDEEQYVGVAWTYYTTKDAEGETLYVSRMDYENWLKAGARIVGDEEAEHTGLAVALPEEEGETASEEPTEALDAALAEAADTEAESAENVSAPANYEAEAAVWFYPITSHSGMIQIGLSERISKTLLASTEMEYVFASDTLEDGFILAFDDSSEHLCLYNPVEAQIGQPAAELGIPENALSGNDYYGFMRINGIRYFQYFRYADSYFAATSIPASGMFRARAPISLITALTSLILILFLSATVVCTTPNEEILYATMSEEQEEQGWDSRMFSLILPTGKTVSTTRASARWDNSHTPWAEKSPEQKLLFLIGIVAFLLIAYVMIAVLGAQTLFQEGSVIRYIMSGNWDRSLNIFAGSACALVLMFTAIAVALFRVPVRIVSGLFGARSETIGHLILSIVKYGGAIGALFYCLYLVGVDSTGLIASASILSLVVGLGAQSLIKDILAGIFIVFEGEFRVGDIVTISDFRGTVMDIGLRTTKIMAPNGNIKIYNNSDISGVLNMTKETSVASTRISIEYGQDLRYVEAVLERELPKLAEENPLILEGPINLGVSELGESGVQLLIICKCLEKDILGMNRYLNRAVLQIFYENGINVPFPNVTVSQLHTEARKTYEDLEPKDASDGKNDS